MTVRFSLRCLRDFGSFHRSREGEASDASVKNYSGGMQLFERSQPKPFRFSISARNPFAVGGSTVHEEITTESLRYRAWADILVFHRSAGCRRADLPNRQTQQANSSILPLAVGDSTPDIYTMTQRYRVQYDGNWYYLSPTLNPEDNAGNWHSVCSHSIFADSDVRR